MYAKFAGATELHDENDAPLVAEKPNALCGLCDTVLFMWIKPLLELGNKQPLHPEDLFELEENDKASNVYASFTDAWNKQKAVKKEPSVVMAYFQAFGMPFIMAGGLKLIHDVLIFVGPYLLNKIIHFLDDPSEPLFNGLLYVLGLLVSNLIMSLCLRQYFFWCYRVGMRLRSSVITSVYAKALKISVGVLSRRSMGEISNLMSVDSTRLQTLTSYLHAIWYSFIQIGLALYFLWGQVGVACLGGITVIIIAIPVTQKISAYLKTIQKELSEVRDERVKLNNEVLGGIKIIKFQAWEQEFQGRMDSARSRELSVYRKAIYVNTLSGMVYTALPLSVGIATFSLYVSLGHDLDVATALTSLALFEILRFPLFILPMVINNIVEARVSVDRVQSFLLEDDKIPVPSDPLTKPGIRFSNATLVYESIKHKLTKPSSELSTVRESVMDRALSTTEENPTYQNMSLWQILVKSFSLLWWGVKAVLLFCWTCFCGKSPLSAPAKSAPNMSDVEFELLVRRAQVAAAEQRLEIFEAEHHMHKQNTTADDILLANGLDDGGAQRGMGRGKKAARSARRLKALQELEGEEAEADEVGNTVISPLAKGVVGNWGESTQGCAGGDVEAGEVELVIQQGDNSASAVELSPSGKAGAGERVLTLFRVSMQAQRGSLLCIVGRVGSGKSSVLMSLLGDMICVLGKVSIKGKIAFVGQRPFIQNSTLRDNILFGSPYEEARYQHALKVCALLPDLEVLQAGDQTEIGERGINLSGGQKARVALARAVYADAEVILLDDPLAAVDAHVGQHLFEQCIMGLLDANKCVILVTNALQFIREATDIVVLENGSVVEYGSFQDLIAQKGIFCDMIDTHAEGMTAADGARGLCDATDEVDTTASEPIVSLLETEDNDTNEVASPTATGTAPARQRAVSLSSSVSSSTSKFTKELAEKQAKEAAEKEKGRLINMEDREVGSVSIKVYGKWTIAAGGLYAGAIVICMFVMGECISVLASYWLSYWSAHRDDHSAWYYLKIYIAINSSVLVMMTIRDLYLAMVGWKASRRLFEGMVVSVLHAPMAFFDTTPMGRILNRFTKDVLTVDVDIPRTVKMYLGTLAKVISTVLYISVITPLFLVGLGPITYFYYRAQQYFIKTSRELTRLDSISRSPIYALFSETLDGLCTIRAYREEERLTKKTNQLLDTNQQAYFLNFSANCWLGIRLEFAGTMIITFCALAAVLSRQWYVDSSEEKRHEFAGMAGLAISLALGVTQSLNWSVRMASDLESQMVAVERLENFATMEQEAEHVKPATDPSDDSHWPTAGDIKMVNVSMRYRKDLPLVLAGVSVHITPREKVGIVGRTGAGKSSLVTAILRLVELDGGIVEIDGVNVATLGLRKLRSSVAVIPQDPVLFSGTIRSNLDPFNLYSDAQIWESVRRTQLADHVCTLSDKVDDNGSNFSVGQRQLLCIARALLSKAKIIIMDEATAAVDVETDAAIQQTIREEFAYATCLTVAHRLNTILDSDKVMVMDKGRIAEYDTPSKLLGNPKSLFFALVENWESAQENDDDDQN